MSVRDENILYWIWLSERCGIASREFVKLYEKYEDPFEIYRMEEEEIERIEGISQGLKIKLFDKSLVSAYEILRYCKSEKVDIVSFKDKRYPSRLKNIQDPPVLFYLLGRLPNMDDRLCIGIVGTRKISEYGRDTSYKISYELASANAVTVSGMALGVDGVAACGSLSAGGQTVAVLGCGISVAYPKAHIRLMRKIAMSGAVITEYPPFEEPHGYNFPKRNRIISGLCQGVLVVEGSANSGSLITAKKAIEQGRELFALPGKINESNSEGPNELIKNGALVALSAEDIILHYDFLYHDCINYKGLRRAMATEASVDKALSKYGVADVYRRDLSYRPEVSKILSHKTGEEYVGGVKASADKETEVESQRSTEATSERRSSDMSEQLLAGLDEVSRRVFAALPMDRAVCADAIVVEGVGIGDIITSLTMLEINGLVQSLPGGTYIRK